MLFYAFHQTNAAAFSVIDAVNKYSANVYPVFCFIREYNGCPDQIFFYHCRIQMSLPSHLFMPFYRIKSGRTVTFYSADIYICFKSSDRHFHDFFYLICFCFDNNHLTSPNCLKLFSVSKSNTLHKRPLLLQPHRQLPRCISNRSMSASTGKRTAAIRQLCSIQNAQPQALYCEYILP